LIQTIRRYEIVESELMIVVADSRIEEKEDVAKMFGVFPRRGFTSFSEISCEQEKRITLLQSLLKDLEKELSVVAAYSTTRPATVKELQREILGLAQAIADLELQQKKITKKWHDLWSDSSQYHPFMAMLFNFDD
jgi:hypothetical protein